MEVQLSMEVYSSTVAMQLLGIACPPRMRALIGYRTYQSTEELQDPTSLHTRAVLLLWLVLSLTVWGPSTPCSSYCMLQDSLAAGELRTKDPYCFHGSSSVSPCSSGILSTTYS